MSDAAEAAHKMAFDLNQLGLRLPKGFTDALAPLLAAHTETALFTQAEAHERRMGMLEQAARTALAEKKAEHVKCVEEHAAAFDSALADAHKENDDLRARLAKPTTRVTHVCGYDWLTDGSYGCPACAELTPPSTEEGKG